MKRCVIACLLVFTLTPLTVYGESEEDALTALRQMGIPYYHSESVFLSSVREGDSIAVRLFLDAGMSPDVIPPIHRLRITL